jgi:3-oxoacyl-(acyl-carrier-protein) synthase/enoyl-CoA hydratase/carnithine racemase/acyl carrier protein/thioredoxin reductase
MLLPNIGTSFAIAGMTSARGRSHTFDARADGYARGEACGGVALRRDDVGLGLLGSAVRQDGRSASLTAPNGQAQQGLLVAALQDAGTTAAALGLSEAHGTGTELGDPIEAGSLIAAVLSNRETPLAVGGVKANIGHAEPAAGMTGLLKLALGLRSGEAAPNAQLRVLNPFLGGTLRVAGFLPVQLAEAMVGSVGSVSSFGYSGTIVHAVLRRSMGDGEVAAAMLALAYRRREFSWSKKQTNRPAGIRSIEERLAASNSADLALDNALAGSVHTVMPEHADVAIVGAGLAGTSLASSFAAAGANSLVVLEKSSTAGGTWRHHGNAFSRVNSSEPAYRLPVARKGPMTNHSYHSEIITETLQSVEQHGLPPRFQAHAHVFAVASTKGGGWLLAGKRWSTTRFVLPCIFSVLATNRRLGSPRNLELPGEAAFEGSVHRGLGGDVNALKCAGERVVVLGMGAFAIENMRTSFERGAVHATILCRRRGTACPQIVDWVNFIRPFGDEYKRGAAGDAVMLSHWQKAYDFSGATRPDCWKQGILKPDGHTVSTSDMYFIAHHLQVMETRLGEVARLDKMEVLTTKKDWLAAGVVIKCVGFELNEGNERLLGRAHMKSMGKVERGLWLQIEAHLDSRTFNNPFGSSYLNGVSFNSKLMTRYWKHSKLAAQLTHAELLSSRTNTIAVNDMLKGSDQLQKLDPEVPVLLQQHLVAVSDTFNSVMSPAEYSAQNLRLWDAIHELLLVRSAPDKGDARFAYPFARLWQELPDLKHLVSTEVQQEEEQEQLSRAVSLEEVLQATTQVIGGNHVDADTPLMDAGLDSLSATELRSSLQTLAGVELPATLVFEAPTARQIATVLAGDDGSRRTNRRPASRRARPQSHLGGQTVAVSLKEVLDTAMHVIGGNVDADTPLMDAGLDSLSATELRSSLQAKTGGAELPATLVFEAPTARQIATVLAGDDEASVPDAVSSSAASDVDLSLDGCAMRLPKSASDSGAAWRISASACEMLGQVPASRWRTDDQSIVSARLKPEQMGSMRHAGFVVNVQHFNNRAFAISPAEAMATDPQQRLLLEHGYEALHATAQRRDSLLGSRAGVFLGMEYFDFNQIFFESKQQSVFAANGGAMAGGRTSFVLGLHGPCMFIGSTCSAGLVAASLGCDALTTQDCSPALAMAASLILRPYAHMWHAQAGGLSRTGRCYTFDARADGFARGEAVIASVIQAGRGGTMIAGRAVRSDGRSASFTAPNGRAQQEMLGAALEKAGAEADSIGIYESHGTGTALGDPTEVGSMAAVLLRPRLAESDAIALSGVKGNLGHVEPGAGLAGMLLLECALRARQASPNAQLRVMNQHVRAALTSGVCVAGVHMPHASKARMAGVSSLGINGTIAHTILACSSGRDHSAALPSLSVGDPGARLAYRRRAFTWRDTPRKEAVSSAMTALPKLGTPPSQASTMELDRRARQRGNDLGTLVRLGLDGKTGLATLELNDPQRFNTMSWACGDDMRRAVEYLHERRSAVRAVTLQASGSVFCAGGNPYGSAGPVTLAALTERLLESVEGFVGVRELTAPVVCAVHGAMVGGAAAIFLHANLLLAESASTFQHGNLSRGVCPIAGYSRMLPVAVGASHASAFYITDRRLAATHALAIGFVHAVHTGLSKTKERALRLAYQFAQEPQASAAALVRGCVVDAQLLADEGIRHIECQLTNSGLVLGTVVDGKRAIALEWQSYGAVPLCGQQACQAPAKFSAAECATAACVDATTRRRLGFEELEAESMRLRLPLEGADAVRPERLRSRHGNASSNIGARGAVHLGIGFCNGIAVLKLDDGEISMAINAAVGRLSELKSAVRAVVLTVADACLLPRCTSQRAKELMQQAVTVLHGFGVPIVCSSRGEIGGLAQIAWFAADHNLTAAPTDVEGGALGFAAWLTHHPAIGQASMLALIRSQQISQQTAAARGKFGRLQSACTLAETQVQLQQLDAEDASCLSTPTCRPGLSNLGGLTTLGLGSPARPSAARRSRQCKSGVHALEMYVPRHCVDAAAVEAHNGSSSTSTRALAAEHYSVCGEDEDNVSMALTSTYRLLRRCGVRSSEVGSLQIGMAASLLDRSKSMKSELMSLVESGCSDGTEASVEGGDHYGRTGTDVILDSVSWVQSESWDGRWALAVCTGSGFHTSSSALFSMHAASVTVLVGAASPHQLEIGLRDATPHAYTQLERAPFIGFPANSMPLLESASLGMLCLGASLQASQPLRFSSTPAALDDQVLTSKLASQWLLDAVAFAALCARHVARIGQFGSLLARPSGAQPNDAFYLQERMVNTEDGAAWRAYNYRDLATTIEYVPRRGPLRMATPRPISSLPAAVGNVPAPELLVQLISSVGTSTALGAAATPIARDGDTVDVKSALTSVAAELLPGVSADVPLMESGLDSLGAVEFRNRLATKLSGAVEPAEELVFDFPTLRQIEAHLASLAPPPSVAPAASVTAPAPAAGLNAALLAQLLGGSAAAVPCTQPLQQTVDVTSALTSVAAELLPGVSADVPLMESGLDSLGAVEFRNRLATKLGDAVEPAEELVFDFPTLRQIEAHIATLLPAIAAAPTMSPTAPLPQTTISSAPHSSTVGLNFAHVSTGLVLLKEGAKRVPLVGVFGGFMGHPTSFVGLARTVETTVYGVIHPHFQTRRAEELEVESYRLMAEMWSGAIVAECQVVGTTEFDLVCLSIGGLLANEIAVTAQNATALQHRPRKLVLIDPAPLPVFRPWSSVMTNGSHARAHRLAGILGGSDLDTFKSELDRAVGDDLPVLLAERRAKLGFSPFTASLVLEANQELRVVKHLTDLHNSHVAHALGPEQRFHGDLLLVLSSKREEFFMSEAGLSQQEAGADAARLYGHITRELSFVGDHIDVIARCLSNREPEFTGAVLQFLSQDQEPRGLDTGDVDDPELALD